jgi:hypothetical protein
MEANQWNVSRRSTRRPSLLVPRSWSSPSQQQLLAEVSLLSEDEVASAFVIRLCIDFMDSPRVIKHLLLENSRCLDLIVAKSTGLRSLPFHPVDAWGSGENPLTVVHSFLLKRE